MKNHTSAAAGKSNSLIQRLQQLDNKKYHTRKKQLHYSSCSVCKKEFNIAIDNCKENLKHKSAKEQTDAYL